MPQSGSFAKNTHRVFLNAPTSNYKSLKSSSTEISRPLAIFSKFRRRRWDNTTVPEIRLEGRWLEDLGFKEGGQVQIEQEAQKLIITFHGGDES